MRRARHLGSLRALGHLRRRHAACKPRIVVCRAANRFGADWSRATQSPFAIGAFLATAAISLQAVVKTTERARLPPASGKCKACKAGGDGLLACSFCTAVYHNSEACLGEAQVVSEALAKSASFPWACPACFKKGVAAVQRAVLKPMGQRAAGAKKPRKKRAKK